MSIVEQIRRNTHVQDPNTQIVISNLTTYMSPVSNQFLSGTRSPDPSRYQFRSLSPNEISEYDQGSSLERNEGRLKVATTEDKIRSQFNSKRNAMSPSPQNKARLGGNATPLKMNQNRMKSPIPMNQPVLVDKFKNKNRTPILVPRNIRPSANKTIILDSSHSRNGSRINFYTKKEDKISLNSTLGNTVQEFNFGTTDISMYSQP